MLKSALLAVVCAFGFCPHAAAASLPSEASAFDKLIQDIAKLKTATDLTPQQCYSQGYTPDGHGGCKAPPSYDRPIAPKDVNVTRLGVNRESQLPAPDAELASDAAACNDHRPQLLSELHDAQRHLIAIENWTMPPPYYGGPAFAHRLLAFNQHKQNLEAYIRAQIADLNAEGQREYNCLTVRASRRESSSMWKHIAAHDVSYFWHHTVTLYGEYFDGGPEQGHSSSPLPANVSETTLLSLEVNFNPIMGGSFLMQPHHHLDPQEAVRVLAESAQAQATASRCLPPDSTSLSPCTHATITGEIKQCVAPQNFPEHWQKIADRNWGRWLCLYAVSISPEN